MMSIPFVAILPGLIVAALAPAKVTDVKTDSSAGPAAKPPSVIYVKMFSITKAESKSENAGEQGRPGEHGYRGASGSATGTYWQTFL
jgi:hypothetical protein